MRKKFIFLALGPLLSALSVSAEAQQPKKIPRIGYIAARSGPEANEKAFLGVCRHSVTLRDKR